MKTYTSLLDVEKDLKVLELEREIAIEELKSIKNDYVEKFKLVNIAVNVLKFTSKYGILLYFKNFFKRKK